LNPTTSTILVNGKEYDYMWQDFGSFKRLVVFKDGKRFGYRNLSISVDEGLSTINYFILRMCQSDSEKVVGKFDKIVNGCLKTIFTGDRK
jgi:hypothetical protein